MACGQNLASWPNGNAWRSQANALPGPILVRQRQIIEQTLAHVLAERQALVPVAGMINVETGNSVEVRQ